MLCRLEQPAVESSPQTRSICLSLAYSLLLPRDSQPAPPNMATAQQEKPELFSPMSLRLPQGRGGKERPQGLGPSGQGRRNRQSQVQVLVRLSLSGHCGHRSLFNKRDIRACGEVVCLGQRALPQHAFPGEPRGKGGSVLCTVESQASPGSAHVRTSK